MQALQYVCASLDSHFLKPVIRKEISRMLLGRGIAWAQGWSFTFIVGFYMQTIRVPVQV